MMHLTARLPTGKWAVLAPDEGAADVYRVVGEFADEHRAVDYARICSAPPPPKPSQARLPAPGGERKRFSYEALLAELPRLFEAHPGGIPTRALVERGVDYFVANAALRRAGNEGHGVWEKIQGRNAKGLLPPGTPAPTPVRQQVAEIKHGADAPDDWCTSVLAAMAADADRQGCTSVAMAALAARTSVPLSAIGLVQATLVRRGEIMLSRPRNGPNAAVYQITRKTKKKEAA